jgi:alkylated DNA repair protein alkB family protein 6
MYLFYPQIEASPKPRWKVLTHRRLQTWPSGLSKDTLLESSLPQWLSDPVIPRILSLPVSSGGDANIFAGSLHQAPNHVLVNEYLPGQGIMPHKDGSAYYPVVCTVSLGSSLCLDIYGSNEDGSRESRSRGRIFQEPRSLLITTGDIYTDYLHGIADVTADVDLNPDTVANWSLLRAPDYITGGINKRATRISLTYRDVLRTIKLGSKVGVLIRH